MDDPVTLVLIPGFLGGLAIASLFIGLHRQPPTGVSADRFTNEPPSTDVINMARIRVAGVGGLCFIAMALAVAWVVPRIGRTLAAGFVLGAGVAVVMILARRRSGAMPSSGRRPGANTTLSIDAPRGPDDEDAPPNHDRSEP